MNFFQTCLMFLNYEMIITQKTLEKQQYHNMHKSPYKAYGDYIIFNYHSLKLYIVNTLKNLHHYNHS